MYSSLAKKFGCSSELKSSWLIVLSQILFTFKSYLISVIRCGRKKSLLYDWCLEAVARPRQINRDRGQDQGRRSRDRDRGRGSQNSDSRLPRGEARLSASTHHITDTRTDCLNASDLEPSVSAVSITRSIVSAICLINQ